MLDRGTLNPPAATAAHPHKPPTNPGKTLHLQDLQTRIYYLVLIHPGAMSASPPVLPGTGSSQHEWVAKFQTTLMQHPHAGQESPVQSIKWKTHF